MRSIQGPSFVTARLHARGPQRLTLLLVALAVCGGCRRGHGHPGHEAEHAEDAGLGGSEELQAGAPGQNNRVCTDDASTCRQSSCNSAADCAPAVCMRPQCIDGQCSHAAVPAGSACGAGQVCSQLGSCGDCVPGTQRCVPGSATLIETCSDDGTWQRSSCEGQACFNAQCTGECEPGSATCEDGKLRTCGVEGRFASAVACAAGGCEHGACPAECSVSEARCLDLYRMQTCSSTGTWGPITACNGQPCDLARGSCQNACSPGIVRCSGDELTQCDSNARWATAVSCPHGCTARGCNSCRPGTQECVDDHSTRTCGEDGAWQEATPCPLGCQQQRCALCRQGDLRCNANVLEVCAANGSWSEREHCSAGCQNNHCNACVPSTAICPSQQDSELIQFCKPDGTWKPIEGCRAHAHCVGGTGNTCPCDKGYQPTGQPGDPNAGSCMQL